MTTKATTKYLALFAGALLATAATAGDKDHSKDHSMKSANAQFEQLDTNHDRTISKSEASADRTLTAAFSSVDADGDGQLSKTEYTAHLNKERMPRESETASYD